MGPRTTRSNKEFSPWDLCHLPSDFDFDGLIKAKIMRDIEAGESLEDDDPEDNPEDMEEQEQGLRHDGEVQEDPDGPAPPAVGVKPNPPRLCSIPPTLSATGSSLNVSIPDLPLPTNQKRKGDISQKNPAKKQKNETAPPSNHKKRRNKASHNARAKKRANPDFGSAAPRQSIQARYADSGATVGCSMALDETKATSTGFVALRDNDSTRSAQPLEYFVGENSKLNFTHEHWDGSKPTLLIDKNRRLVGVLAGHPDDENWSTLQRQAADALENARKKFVRANKRGRRGVFVTARCGVSHGGGQKEPSNMNNSPQEEKVLEELNEMEFFQRVSSFSSSVMATRAPHLYQYYSTQTGRLYQRHHRLKRQFRRSVFCGTTYNLGPRTVCFKHRDTSNLAFGWCAITSAGDFDHTAGGHLVLWDFRLVIDFPPGSTILIPSAIIAHSNTSIQTHERRYSFTQYTAGALFRWVDSDFQPTAAFRQSLTPEELEKLQKQDEERWEMGLNLLPIIPEPDASPSLSP